MGGSGDGPRFGGIRMGGTIVPRCIIVGSYSEMLGAG